MKESDIKVGDLFIYRGDHEFYTVKSIKAKKLIEIDCPLWITLVYKNNFIKEYFLRDFVNLIREKRIDSSIYDRWYPVKDKNLPEIKITEGKKIIIRGTRYIVIRMNSDGFNLAQENSPHISSYIEFERANRLYYTGFWR